MKLEQKIEIKPELKPILKAYITNLMEVVQLPLLELHQKIEQELEENPLLEREVIEGIEQDSSEEFDMAEDDDEINEILNYFLDSSEKFSYGTYFLTKEQEERREYFQTLLIKPKTLQEHLLQQLHFLKLTEKEYEIGETIIGEIDERGYLKTPVEEIARITGAETNAVERILKKIQEFEPTGVGARDLRECLLIQIKNLKNSKETSLAYKIVDKYFDLLVKQHYDKIARKLKVFEYEIKEVIEKIIKKLNPSPGISFSSESPEYVVPEAEVKVNEKGEIIIKLNQESIPRLFINPSYKAMLKRKDIQPEVKKYIRKKLQRAILLMRSLEQRGSMLYQVIKAIAEYQKEFFIKGPENIKPLTLKEIAEKVNVHESTISRIVNGKYIQTPWGVYELKYFFATQLGYAPDISSRRIMYMIKEIIKNENKPLSDTQIAAMLKKKGIKVARRTVAKYRNLLGILPSRLRKNKP